MTKKYSRKNQNRPPKPLREPKHEHKTLPENQGQQSGTVTLRAVTHQDSILPVELKFPPPLIELATDPSTFEYNWQHLTYAFDLPDPADFPPLTRKIDPEDARSLIRFVQVCAKTARYTVVSHKGGISMHSENGETKMTFEQTEDEETVGFSVRFRQLHSSSAGDPDFSKVANILAKYIREEDDGRSEERMAIVAQWRRARAALMSRPLQNINCRTVLEKDGCPPDKIEEHEMYGDVNPAEIINLFNYGELIHFGKHSEDYEALAIDPEREAIQHHNFMVAMLGLVHLYFGFSRLIVAAVADQRRIAA